MSRSKRKTPICGHCLDSEKKDKRISNRKIRRKNTDLIKKGLYDQVSMNPNLYGLNVWNMSKDGKGYYGDIEDKEYVEKLMRK